MPKDAIDASYLLKKGEEDECEPIEAWQVEAVGRLPGDYEHVMWGDNGAYILSWFDLGDTRSQLYQTPLTELPEVMAEVSAWARMVGWMRTMAGNPPPYRLVGSHA